MKENIGYAQKYTYPPTVIHNSSRNHKSSCEAECSLKRLSQIIGHTVLKPTIYVHHMPGSTLTAILGQEQPRAWSSLVRQRQHACMSSGDPEQSAGLKRKNTKQKSERVISMILLSTTTSALITHTPVIISS